MTERLAEISARITGVRQLGSVVGAMRGIAAARAQQARAQSAAVDSYTAIIVEAIGRALPLVAPDRQARDPQRRLTEVVFCAEQGFAGAFSERVMAAADRQATLFLIGTRGLALAGERHMTPAWSTTMPSHAQGIPKLADDIMQALTRQIAQQGVDQLDVVFTNWQPGHDSIVQRRHLLPFDPTSLPPPSDCNAPLLNFRPVPCWRGW